LENLSQNFQQSLNLLIYSSIIMLIITTVFLVKLLADLSNLAKSLQNLSIILKHELGPTLKEFKRAVININSLASGAGTQLDDFNRTVAGGIGALSGTTKDMFGKSRVILDSVRQGILTGLRVLFEGKK
jgi:hypothetical protein